MRLSSVSLLNLLMVSMLPLFIFWLAGKSAPQDFKFLMDVYGPNEQNSAYVKEFEILSAVIFKTLINIGPADGKLSQGVAVVFLVFPLLYLAIWKAKPINTFIFLILMFLFFDIPHALQFYRFYFVLILFFLLCSKIVKSSSAISILSIAIHQFLGILLLVFFSALRLRASFIFIGICLMALTLSWQNEILDSVYYFFRHGFWILNYDPSFALLNIGLLTRFNLAVVLGMFYLFFNREGWVFATIFAAIGLYYAGCAGYFSELAFRLSCFFIEIFVPALWLTGRSFRLGRL